MPNCGKRPAPSKCTLSPKRAECQPPARAALTMNHPGAAGTRPASVARSGASATPFAILNSRSPITAA